MSVLEMLRGKPAMAVAAYGFVVRGQMLRDAVGGGCALTCTRIGLSGVYRLDVGPGQRDWFIPFSQGQARYVNVPKNQPDGTLVVTYPMNGCALEVAGMTGCNRFFHDSDGKSMPQGNRDAKARIEYDTMAGPDENLFVKFQRALQAGPIAGNFEHTIICVKSGGMWSVYQTCVITAGAEVYQVKDRVPSLLGAFAD